MHKTSKFLIYFICKVWVIVAWLVLSNTGDNTQHTERAGKSDLWQKKKWVCTVAHLETQLMRLDFPTIPLESFLPADVICTSDLSY